MKTIELFLVVITASACNRITSRDERSHVDMSQERSAFTGNANATSTPCASHPGKAQPFEGSGACTGNLMTTIPLPTAGIALIHNSLNTKFNNCLSPGWSVSIDSFVTLSGSTGATLTRGDGSSAEFTGTSGSTILVALDPTISKNKLQATPPMTSQAPSGDVAKFATAPVNGRYYLTETSDRFGQKTVYARNAAGCVTQITSPTNDIVTLSYNAGKLSRVVDATGAAYGITYDASSGDLQQVTQPDGRFWQVRTGANHLLDSIRTPAGQPSRYTYVTGKDGWVETITDAYGSVTSFTYTPSSVTITQGSDTSTETFTTGRLTAFTSRGATTQINRDSDGRITSTVDALGKITQITYAGAPNLNNRVNFLPATLTTPDKVTTSYTYDPATFDILQKNETYQGKAVTTNYTWDNYGQILTQETNGKTMRYNRSNGNLTSLVDPNGQTLFTATYDATGNVLTSKDQFNRVTSYTWQNGRVAQVTDPLGRPTAYVYDDTRHTVTVTGPDGVVTEYVNDAMDEPVRKTVQSAGHRLSITRMNKYAPSGDATATLPGSTIISVTTEYDKATIEMELTEFRVKDGNEAKISHVVTTMDSGGTSVVLENENNGSFGPYAYSAPFPAVVK